MSRDEAFNFIYQAPFGPVGVRLTDRYLTNLVLCPEEPHIMRGRVPALAHEVTRQLDRYFDSVEITLSLPLLIKGTPYQRDVWSIMRTIPPGQTRTYGQLASVLGSGPRAIAQACRSNRLPLVIPCHRVVASTGPGGFMGRENRTDIKQFLLRHEGVNVH